MDAHPLLARAPEDLAGASLPKSSPEAWGLEHLAGRFVEIAGGPDTAGLTLCARLIAEGQRRGGLAAWVGGLRSGFYPPDLAASGIDLASLAVVKVADARRGWRACDTLLRSGGFTLVVADLTGGLELPFGAQSRLAALARHHHAALVALTLADRSKTPRSSLVSLRAETAKHRAGHDCFACEARVVKDKGGTPGWMHQGLHRGTDGLC